MLILAVVIVLMLVAAVGAWFSGWLASGARAKPNCLAPLLTRRQRASHAPYSPPGGDSPSGNAALKGRQNRHQSERQTA